MTAQRDALHPALRTYVRFTAVTAALFMLLLIDWLGRAWLGLPARPAVTGVLTLACALAVAAHLWTLLRAVQASDEFMRTVMAKRLLTAAMIVIGFCAIWGLAGSVGLVGAFPLQLVYFGYFLVHLALIPFINADRP